MTRDNAKPGYTAAMKRMLLLIAWCWVLASTATAEESWYVVLLGEERAGHVHRTELHEDGRIITSTVMELTVARGLNTIQISMSSRFDETEDGEPVSASSSLNMGGVPIETELTFTEADIRVRAMQGGRVEEGVQPLPDLDWLPPAAAARHVDEQLEAGAETITTTTMDPSMGVQPITITANVLGREEVEVFGRTVPAVVWEATTSNLPGIAMREYVDEDGRPLKSTVALMPGLEITIIEADRDLALSPLTAPEMMVATLIEPTGQPLRRPRDLRRAAYRLSSPKPMDLPTVAIQRWSAGGRTLTVDLDLPVDSPAPGAEQLASSVVLNHEDAAVRALLEEALEGFSGSDAQAAEQLRRFVHGFVDSKDLSVGFATASEVARTGTGDCTEHGVLLAALLRGQGIPARCVSGLIYADAFLGQRGVFGYHLWTQAWFDPDGDEGPQPARWVDLDATLGPKTPTDATHIALSVSDMNEPVPANDLVQLAPLLGNLQIEVLEAE